MSTELDLAVGKAVEPGYSKRDSRLLDAWSNGMTPDQIEQALNIPAAQAVLRVKHLLSTRDALTEYEQKQLLMYSAYKFKTVMDKALPYVADDPKLATNYLRMIEIMSKLLKEQGEISQRELSMINEAQARAIVGAVEKAFYAVTGYLRENNPEVNINELNAVFRKAVQEGLVTNAPE